MWQPAIRRQENCVVWEPRESSGKVLKGFRKRVEEKYSLQFNNYWDLHKWSVDNYGEFWSEIYDFFDVIHSKKYDQVVDVNVSMSESPKWFEGAELNFAENLLKYRDDHVALILAGEDRETERITYAERFKEAELYAAAFRKWGLKKNDIVVCYMSNRKEAVYAMLATVSIGAIWTGALPLMGAQAVLNRFEQVKPSFLITVDRFVQAGVEIDMLPNVQSISQGLPSLEKVIIVPSKEESKCKDISGIPKSCFLADFLKSGLLDDGSVPPMKFEQVSFSHPVFISYTSGTTGLPKPIVHGCGILLGVSEFTSLHYNGDRDSIWLSASPVGWISWIFNATLPFLGMNVVLYEGSPYFLSPTYIWDLVDEFRLTTIVLPSSTLDELQKRRFIPQKNHNLSSLKYIMAGGSVVKPENYEFVYEHFNGKVILATGYAGTELMGCCLITEPTLPVFKGEISAPGLGMLIECLDYSRNPVFGEIGDLVLSQPFPSLALGLWGDRDGSLFREKYFSKYPGMFYLGDCGFINPTTKGYRICGRSDETLMQRGCRFGSSEIYHIVDKFPAVRDSLCVSQYNKDMDERAVLFLKIREGHTFNNLLVISIRDAIAGELTIRHIPDVILETKDIPYNMNGKKMEVIVKKIINKMHHTKEAVVNQESLEFYYNVPELLQDRF